MANNCTGWRLKATDNYVIATMPLPKRRTGTLSGRIDPADVLVTKKAKGKSTPTIAPMDRKARRNLKRSNKRRGII